MTQKINNNFVSNERFEILMNKMEKQNDTIEKLTERISYLNNQISFKDCVKMVQTHNIIRDDILTVRNAKKEIIKDEPFVPYTLCEWGRYNSSNPEQKDRIKEFRYYERQKMYNKVPFLGGLFYRIKCIFTCSVADTNNINYGDDLVDNSPIPVTPYPNFGDFDVGQSMKNSLSNGSDYSPTSSISSLGMGESYV